MSILKKKISKAMRWVGLATGVTFAVVATTQSNKRIQPVYACAGEWTRAVASIPDPVNGNQMVIRHATSAADAWRRAKKCRADAINATYFDEGVRLACAPYLACDTQ